MDEEVLWNNPNPAQDFVSQTIYVNNLPNYRHFEIYYRYQKNADYLDSTGIKNLDISYTEILYSDSGRLRQRVVNVNKMSGSFTFTNADAIDNYPNPIRNNGVIIPIRIIGYKF